MYAHIDAIHVGIPMIVLSYHAFIYLKCMYDWFCFIYTMICTIHSLVPYHICEIHTDDLHEHVYFHLMRVCETYVDRLHVKVHFHAIHVHTCICVLLMKYMHDLDKIQI